METVLIEDPLYNSLMFSFKFLGLMIISVLFSPKFLKTREENMENYPGSPKNDAKDWADMKIKLTL